MSLMGLVGVGAWAGNAAAKPTVHGSVSVRGHQIVTLHGRVIHARHTWHLSVSARFSTVTAAGTRTGHERRVRVRLRSHGRFRVRLRGSGTTASLRAVLAAGPQPVRGLKPLARSVLLCGGQVTKAEWLQRDPKAPTGWSLSILPSFCGHQTAMSFGQSMLDEAIRDAGGWKDGLNRDSMLTQLLCHAAIAQPLGVPIKSHWNLDGWRSSESLAAMIIDKCNPGPAVASEPTPSAPAPTSPQPSTPATPQPSTPSAPPTSPAPIFTVMNTSETPPDGVWFRNSPQTADTDRVTGHGVYVNEQVQLRCYDWGDAVGQYNDHLWYSVLNVSRPANAARTNDGWLNAHYIDDGKRADEVDLGVPAC